MSRTWGWGVIRCVIIDLDGTVLSPGAEGAVIAAEAIEALNELGRRGMMWATNSGRDYEDQRRIIEEAVGRGLRALPDAIMANEVYIHSFRGEPPPAWRAWNAAARASLRGFHPRIQQRLSPALAGLRENYRLEHIAMDAEATAFLVAGEGDMPRRFAAELQRILEAEEDAVVLRNSGWVAVLPRHLGKGAVTGAYLRSRWLEAHQALAIGDQLNDLSMLDGRVTAAVGCPGDAAEEVKAAVRRAGGVVASQPGYRGTLEILEKVCGITVGDPRAGRRPVAEGGQELSPQEGGRQ